MKMSALMSLSALALSLNSPLTYAAEPNYNYAGISVGKAHSKVRVANNSFKLDTKTLQAELSHRLSDFSYIRTEINQARTDDSDGPSASFLRMDDKETNASAAIGFIAKLNASNHLTAELGVNHSRYKDHGVFRLNQDSSRFRRSGTNNDVLWSLAWKTAMSDNFELNLRYTKAGDMSIWKLNTPIAITQDLSLELALLYGKDDSDRRRYESNAATVGMRYSF